MESRVPIAMLAFSEKPKKKGLLRSIVTYTEGWKGCNILLNDQFLIKCDQFF
jgi:hypothetical protein